MQIIKCDRCGKELDRFERRHAQVRPFGSSYYFYVAEKYEFCKKCRKELEDMCYKNEKEFLEWMFDKEKLNGR